MAPVNFHTYLAAKNSVVVELIIIRLDFRIMVKNPQAQSDKDVIVNL